MIFWSPEFLKIAVQWSTQVCSRTYFCDSLLRLDRIVFNCCSGWCFKDGKHMVVSMCFVIFNISNRPCSQLRVWMWTNCIHMIPYIICTPLVDMCFKTYKHHQTNTALNNHRSRNKTSGLSYKKNGQTTPRNTPTRKPPDGIHRQNLRWRPLLRVTMREIHAINFKNIRSHVLSSFNRKSFLDF